MPGRSFPTISVIVLNYNGRPWIQRCIESLKNQSISREIEIVFADNLSTDGSDVLAEQLMRDVPHGSFLQHGENLGFCEGNNRAARGTKGRFLLFLNNDAWLEADCLEILLRETELAGAQAACPLILNFDDDSFQSIGAEGFDIFGLPSGRAEKCEPGDVLMPEGCAYFIRRDVFEQLGGFDPVFFMYADEYDLSWRIWTAGYRAVRVPGARVHHRGAANVNPAGGGTVVENRTSDTKRYYANRNALLTLLKNAQHVLLLSFVLQCFLLAAEILIAVFLIRRWKFLKRAYIDALCDCWRLRRHIMEERRKIGALRKRSDWRMLRFLRARLNRWDEIERISRYGLPKVAPK